MVLESSCISSCLNCHLKIARGAARLHRGPPISFSRCKRSPGLPFVQCLELPIPNPSLSSLVLTCCARTLSPGIGRSSSFGSLTFWFRCCSGVSRICACRASCSRCNVSFKRASSYIAISSVVSEMAVGFRRSMVKSYLIDPQKKLGCCDKVQARIEKLLVLWSVAFGDFPLLFTWRWGTDSLVFGGGRSSRQKPGIKFPFRSISQKWRSLIKFPLFTNPFNTMYKWHVHSAIGRGRPATYDLSRVGDGIAASLRQFSISASKNDGGNFQIIARLSVT